jgi:hypothetical protein
MQYVLPVDEKERKTRDWKNIAGAEDPSRDDIAFHSGNPGTVKLDASGTVVIPDPVSNPNARCYATMRPNYGAFDIICVPQAGRGKYITLEQATHFFAHFAELDMLPEGVSLWEDEKQGVCLRSPHSDANPHLIYVALTCYRWVDRHPRLVLEFLHWMDQDVPLHPMQVLTYLIGKYISNCNHSFITTGGWTMQMKGYESKHNPVLGLAAKIYFDQTDPRCHAAFLKPSTNINVTIGKIAKELSPKLETTHSPVWGKPRTVDAPLYVLEESVDGLHPTLYELYTVPNITVPQIQDFLGKHFTQEQKYKEQ